MSYWSLCMIKARHAAAEVAKRGQWRGEVDGLKAHVDRAHLIPIAERAERYEQALRDLLPATEHNAAARRIICTALLGRASPPA